MILDSVSANRLGIFSVYDAEGIIDDYIIVLLKAVKKHLDKLLVVCNGILSPTGRNKLNEVADEILVRENSGYDSWAYKEGIEHIGQYYLSKYDELVLFNYEIMGPVNSFDDMFAYMNAQDVDFWGITKNYSIECSHISKYIRSHFLCVRKSMFLDHAFKKYWKDFPKVNSPLDSFMNYESAFTKKFADMGFKWKTYVETDDIEYMSPCPLTYMTKELVKEKKCPVFERKIFFQEYADVLANTMGNTAREFFDYLVESKRYDVNLIWDNILRTCNQEDFVRNLDLRYILSSVQSDVKKVETILQKRKVALVMHLYFEDLIPDMCCYASYMPKEVDIYITTNSVEKQKKIEKEFLNKLANKKIDVRLIENRGRDVSSILVGVKDVIFDYDYVCFVHDKKTAQLKPGTVGSGFASKCFENVIYNKNFVNNVLCLLENNPRLGLLSPPSPNHADYFGIFGNEWGANYDITKELAEKMEANIPINRNKIPIAPYGTLFWFKPTAFKKLYDLNWKYSDFPAEPNNVDGTLLHAVERMYSLVVQAEGYYPAILMSDYYAGIECTNLDYYTRTFNNKVSEIFGSSYFMTQINRLSQYHREMEIKTQEYHKIKGEKYELELKTLETMNYIESLQKELADVKGQKYELELKAIETMQFIEELQKKATLKYQIRKKIFRKD